MLLSNALVDSGQAGDHLRDADQLVVLRPQAVLVKRVDGVVHEDQVH